MMPVYCGINKEWLKDHDKQMREEGAKAERERVLKEVNEKLTALKDRFAKEEMADGISLALSKKMGSAKIGIGAAIKLMESLRHGQKQDPPSCFGTITKSDACFTFPECRYKIKCKKKAEERAPK